MRGVNGSVQNNTQERDEDIFTAAGPSTSADGVALLKDWLLLPGHEDWLLVLDNYDDIQVDIQMFLPIGATGNVLITTRDRRVIGPVADSGFALLAMDLLDAERLFLRVQSSGTKSDWNEPTSHPEYQILRQILQEIQCFPLAIDQAASFIRENSPMSLQEYLNYLKPRSVDRERLLRFKQTNPKYPDSVMTTWEISLDYLERMQPRASWILQLLGFLDHSYIAEELLTATTKRTSWAFNLEFEGRRLPRSLQTELAYLEDDVGFRLAIGVLTSLSLIRRKLETPTLYVHPLVHEWIRVRLNPTPARQAKFTIAAALILYQSFPLELVTCLPDNFPVISNSLIDRVNWVGHHVKTVLTNLRDYHNNATTMPLECFNFCEVYYLMGFPKHSVFTLDISEELSKDLDQTIRAIVTSLPENLVSMAFFILKVIVWLRSTESEISLKTINRITDSLKSLSLSSPLESSMSPFLLLLTTAVLDTSETVNNTIPAGDKHRRKLKIDHTQLGMLRADQDQQRRAELNLLDSLRTLFSSTDYVSPLIRWIHFMIKFRLLRLLSPEEFAIHADFDLDQMLLSELLHNLSFDQKGVYFCLLVRLLWEYPGSKNYDEMKKVFSILVLECKAELRKAEKLWLEQQDLRLMEAWSHSTYISSSWGRTGEPFETSKITTDLVTPLEYIWENTIAVAEAVSDPRLQWRISSDGQFNDGPLNLSQRRWARDLFSSMESVHKRQRTRASAKASFVDKFNSVDASLALIRIYVNLEDWAKLRPALLNVLQYDKIVEFCTNLKPFPWEYGQVLASSQNPPQEPFFPASQKDDPDTSPWFFLGVRPLRQEWRSKTCSMRMLTICLRNLLNLRRRSWCKQDLTLDSNRPRSELDWIPPRLSDFRGR